MFDRIMEAAVWEGDSIVSGGAPGPDSWAEEWAHKHKITVTVLRPNWAEGRHAGLMRNTEIVRQADEVLAFWDGKSRGTKDTIRKAQDSGKHVQLFVAKE